MIITSVANSKDELDKDDTFELDKTPNESIVSWD